MTIEAALQNSVGDSMIAESAYDCNLSPASITCRVQSVPALRSLQQVPEGFIPSLGHFHNLSCAATEQAPEVLSGTLSASLAAKAAEKHADVSCSDMREGMRTVTAVTPASMNLGYTDAFASGNVAGSSSRKVEEANMAAAVRGLVPVSACPVRLRGPFIANHYITATALSSPFPVSVDFPPPSTVLLLSDASPTECCLIAQVVQLLAHLGKISTEAMYFRAQLAGHELSIAAFNKAVQSAKAKLAAFCTRKEDV